MSVLLNPQELGFRRPFTNEVTQLLRLRNISQDAIAFKVKTTAPKQYCVRPNSGRIEAGSEVEVSVLLQPMKEEPPPDAKCRDKFLVQTIPITPERDIANVAAIWQNVEKTSKGDIQERKIRVLFLPAEGSLATPSHNVVNGTHHVEDGPPAYDSPAPSFGSPAPDATTPLSRAAQVSNGAAPPGEAYRTDGVGLGTTQKTINSATSNNQPPRVAPTPDATDDVSKSRENIQLQPSEAKTNTANPKQEGKEQKIKTKNNDSANEDLRGRISNGMAGMGLQQQPVNGVPVQIVAALCLLSFLLAYFFF